jgi:hypothetical protein
MHDEDQDTLAAEYVLGTLSAEEREQAEALRSFDSGFEAAVRQWERRLGELNVMVEAVEPPAETWEKIKTHISPVELGAEIDAPHEPPPPLPLVAALDADVSPPPIEPHLYAPAETPPPPPPAGDTIAAYPPPSPAPSQIERSADVIYLAGRVARWRRITFAVGALAALLALYIAVWQVAPVGDARGDARTTGSAGRRAATRTDGAGVPAHGRYAAAQVVRAPGVGDAGGREELRAVADFESFPRPTLARNRRQR